MISERRLKAILILLAVIIICGWLTLLYIQSMSSKQQLAEEKLHNLTYLELLKRSIINNIISNETIEKIFMEKLELAENILQQNPQISKLQLQEFCREHQLKEISFIYHDGRVVNSNLYRGIYPHNLSQLDMQEGETTVMIIPADSIQIYGSRMLIKKSVSYYFVGAVSENILLEYTKRTSLNSMINFVEGSLLQNDLFAKSKHVFYVVIQDSLGILAATSNITILKRLQDDLFLENIYLSGKTNFRFTVFDEKTILETVTPFQLDGYDFGVIRLGVSLQRFENAQKNKNVTLLLFSFIFLFSLFLEYLFYRNYRKLQYSKDELSNSRRMVEIAKLGGEVAHEIKNPLNSIYMILQRLQIEFKVKEKEKEFKNLLNISYSEIERLNRIVEQFLSLSKQLKIERKSVDVNRLMKNIVELFNSDVNKTQIKFEIQEQIIFPLDEKLLKQVMINLVKNALEAFDRIENMDEIIISARLQKHNLIISVKDNGGGISAVNLFQIWDIYFTTKKSGSGIGLAICKKIIEGHGGHISAQSVLDKGSEFRIELPEFKE